MTYLLDTHVFLWMQASPERLGTVSREIIEDSHNRLLLSAASAWELAIKSGLGRLSLPSPPAEWVPNRMSSSGVDGLAVQHSHALRVAELPLLHRDPFDRLLVAQAQLEGIPLITADSAFSGYDLDIVAAA